MADGYTATSPFVGPPTATGVGCAFSPALDDRACGESGAVHVCVQSTAWGVVSLVSCGRHAPVARAAGSLLAEHEYRAECDTTDCWPSWVRGGVA